MTTSSPLNIPTFSEAEVVDRLESFLESLGLTRLSP